MIKRFRVLFAILLGVLLSVTFTVPSLATTTGGQYVSDGTLSLQGIASKLGTNPSTLLRMTAVHFGRFDNAIFSYINNLADGAWPPTHVVPSGATFWDNNLTTTSAVQPDGPSGNWNLVWSDEFNGNSIDTNKWYVFDNVARQGVTTHASNVTESGGFLHLTLASASSGAEINSWDTQGAGLPPDGVGLAYGQAVEARVCVPGGSTIPNWPSFWTSGHTQPGDFSGGEIDILEGLSGQLHTDYNNTTAHIVGPAPAGTWGGSCHIYTAVRNGPASAATYDVYWDGQHIWHVGPEAESGLAKQGILLVNGQSSQFGGPLQVPTTMDVDYVRVWSPAS